MQRTLLFAVFSLLALAIAAAPSAATNQGSQPQTYWVFIGTGAGKPVSKGIYRAELDVATGKLSNVELAADTAQPTFIAIHPNKRFLYSVNEGGTPDAKKAGKISAFSLDAKTGKLALLNSQSSGGPGPCHVLVDKDGQNVLAANYGGGSICCLPIQKDGSLAPATTFIQHEGK